MIRVLRQYWFLGALFLVLVAGFGCSESLVEPAQHVPRKMIVAGVLFVMALPLEIRAMWQSLRRPGPAALAFAINMIVVPLLAWPVSKLLPPDLATGVILMAAIPCTLASAAVWTRRAGGNDAVAILVTVTTNLACFAITPFWIGLLTQTEVAIPLAPVVKRLVLLAVLPILLAQLLRFSRHVAHWATANKVWLGVVAQCGILTMVGLGTIASGEKLSANANGVSIGLPAWAMMLGVVILVHLVALFLGHGLARSMGMSRPDRIAVGFAGSQKTLMVGLDLGLQFFGGLTILPMVAYHVCQLLLDTVIADRLREKGQTKETD